MQKNNILDEIYKLESRLNKYHESDAGISFEGLDNSNFDLNRYIQINFTRGRNENVQVDFEQINKTLTFFHEIQKSTCEEIVFSIDQNFEKYIGISTRFEGLKDRLTQTQQQFHYFNELIEEYYKNNTQDLNKLKEVLSTYEQVSKYEIAYRTIEDILLLMEECEKLYSGSSNGDGSFLIENLKKASFLVDLAEKKYQEVSTRQSITADLEEKFRIRECIKKTRDGLLSSVEKHFKDILIELKEGQIDLNTRKSAKRIKVCLESLSTLQASELIHQSLEQIILIPELERAVGKLNEEKTPQGVSPKNFDYQRPGLNSKTTQVKNLYQKILETVKAGPLAELREFSRSGDATAIDLSNVEGFNIILSTWKSVYNLLTSKNFTFIFSVGIADNFNNHYKETVYFLNSLSNLLDTPEEKAEFWGHDTMKRFLAKWSTSTYYQLRFAEIIREYGKFLNEETIKLYVSEKRSISPLKETKTVRDYLEKCFNTRVFNLHLAPKFLKLAYQMLAMYCSSLEEYYVKYYKGQEYTDNKINLLRNMTNEVYSVIYYCEEELVDKVNEAFKQDIAIMNCDSTVQVPAEKNQQYVQSFVNRLQESAMRFEDELSKYLIAKCKTNLEFISSIPKKFRMTNKGKPTEPSNFIDNIFLPLGQFSQDYTLLESSKKNVERLVVNKIYEEFLEKAGKIVELAEKEEETLSKYRNTNVPGAVSDAEKIRHQFYLDNRQISEIIGKTVGAQLQNYNESLFT